jgi:hypothetical protein
MGTTGDITKTIHFRRTSFGSLGMLACGQGIWSGKIVGADDVDVAVVVENGYLLR